MALLCADQSTGILKLYTADKKHCPYRKALQRVEEAKNSKKLPSRWASTAPLGWPSNALPHSMIIIATCLPSRWGFSQRLSEAEPGAVIGPDFDPAKIKIYRDEFRTLRCAPESLESLVTAIDRALS